MKIELKKFGDILTSRSAGREAYLAIRSSSLRDLKEGEAIEIDFEGVRVLAPSWADEVITKLTQEFDQVEFLNLENEGIADVLKFLKEYSSLKYDFQK